MFTILFRPYSLAYINSSVLCLSIVVAVVVQVEPISDIESEEEVEVTDISDEEGDERDDEFFSAHRRDNHDHHEHIFGRQSNGTSAPHQYDDSEEDVFKAPAPPPFFGPPSSSSSRGGLPVIKSEPDMPPAPSGHGQAPLPSPSQCIPLKLRFKRRWDQEQHTEEAEDKKVKGDKKNGESSGVEREDSENSTPHKLSAELHRAAAQLSLENKDC